MEPRPFSDTAFNLFLEEEQLMGNKCIHCGALFVPPRPICIKCRHSEMQWVEMSGQGVLVAFTCVAIGPASMIAEGYNRKNPYCVGVVELAEGARVDARIQGVDATQPETIKVGTPMQVKFLHRQRGEDKETYLAFEPR